MKKYNTTEHTLTHIYITQKEYYFGTYTESKGTKSLEYSYCCSARPLKYS